MNIQKEGNKIIYLSPSEAHSLYLFHLNSICLFIYISQLISSVNYTKPRLNTAVFIVRGQTNCPSLWLMCVLCKAVERRHEEITSSAKLWPQMKERQSERVRRMSTFRRTNGMSVKRWYTDAFSPERPEMLSGDAALLFQPYSGCTGNILSFYPSTSPRSDPLTINDFFFTPSPSLPPLAFPRVGLLIFNATFFSLFSLSPATFFAFLPIYFGNKDWSRVMFLWNKEKMQVWVHVCCKEVPAPAPVRM